MIIKRAENKDIKRVIELLEQVLEVHAKIRPDIFISGTTKYVESELEEMFKDDSKPIYVALDENGECMGYAFCQIREPVESNNIVPFKSIYIDDLCVDETKRKTGVGEALFNYVKNEAKKLGCYEITLNVWEGNDSAKRFYEKMGLKIKSTMMEFIL